MEDNFEKIEKIAKKYYEEFFEPLKFKSGLIQVEFILNPKNDEVKSFGDVSYYTTWDKFESYNLTKKFLLIETNDAYNSGGLFTKVFGMDKKMLNRWMQMKSKKYLESTL